MAPSLRMNHRGSVLSSRWYRIWLELTQVLWIFLYVQFLGCFRKILFLFVCFALLFHMYVCSLSLTVLCLLFHNDSLSLVVEAIVQMFPLWQSILQFFFSWPNVYVCVNNCKNYTFFLNTFHPCAQGSMQGLVHGSYVLYIWVLAWAPALYIFQ